MTVAVAHLGLARAARAHRRAARSEPASAPAHPLHRLNQQAGNAAVSRLIARLQDASAVQREELPEEEEEPIQAMHDTAVRREEMPEEEEPLQASHDPAGAAGTIGLDGGELDDAAAARIDGMRGAGSTLSENLRRTMEPALGMDLGGVRVHQDSAADALARGMTAKAFTTGTDIFLRNDASTGDSHLMAHELAHVAQQATGGGGAGQRMAVGPADDPLEAEADAVAKAAIDGGPAARSVEDELR